GRPPQHLKRFESIRVIRGYPAFQSLAAIFNPLPITKYRLQTTNHQVPHSLKRINREIVHQPRAASPTISPYSYIYVPVGFALTDPTIPFPTLSAAIDRYRFSGPHSVRFSRGANRVAIFSIGRYSWRCPISSPGRKMCSAANPTFSRSRSSSPL